SGNRHGPFPSQPGKMPKAAPGSQGRPSAGWFGSLVVSSVIESLLTYSLVVLGARRERCEQDAQARALLCGRIEKLDVHAFQLPRTVQGRRRRKRVRRVWQYRWTSQIMR